MTEIPFGCLKCKEFYEQGYKEGESSVTVDLIAYFDEILDIDVENAFDAAMKVKEIIERCK